MLTGLNGIIIQTSKYYRYQSVFIFLLLILVISTNYIFIPIYGIVGAEIASLLSTIIFNVTRFFFLYKKFSLQPFNHRILIITALLALVLATDHYLFNFKNFYLLILLKVSLIVVLYILPIYWLKLSDNFNQSLIRPINYLLKKDNSQVDSDK